MIGVLQIITGNLISIYNHGKYKGWQHMLFPTGKLLIISSLIWIFLADMQKLEALQAGGILRQGMLYTGLALVIFFHQLGVPVYKRAVNAFMPLFFIFTGILGDILSYVRLFALGLASSILGLVVNQIGGQIMEGGILSLVLGIVFLIFGHSLNLAIAALGSFVHPLRLTFVEFYSNVGFTGKGIEYKPFSKTIKQ
jgi:Archaeal/vacuolar-type H+-ATPase subunit I